MYTWVSTTCTHGSTNYNVHCKCIHGYQLHVHMDIFLLNVYYTHFRLVEFRTICKNMPASSINIYYTSIQQKDEYQKRFMIFCLKQLSGYLTVNRYPDSKRQDQFQPYNVIIINFDYISENCYTLVFESLQVQSSRL